MISNRLIQIFAETLYYKFYLKDKKFLKLIKDRLALLTFDTKEERYEQTFIGIPQGGIDSPYLWNIYLLGLDDFVLNDVQQYIDKLNVKRLKSKGNGISNKLITTVPQNPIYNRYSKLIVFKNNQIKITRQELKSSSAPKIAYKKLFNLLEEKRLISHKKRSVSPNRIKIRLVYTRYADDWIVITNAPNCILQILKNMIADWLKKERSATLQNFNH